jgi:hypothetical protein
MCTLHCLPGYGQRAGEFAEYVCAYDPEMRQPYIWMPTLMPMSCQYNPMLATAAANHGPPPPVRF